jgi:phospholipase C
VTNSENPPGAAGSARRPGRAVVPGVSRRRFLQATGLGAATAAAVGFTGGSAAASTAGQRAAAGGSAAGEAAGALPEGWTGTIADLKHVVILMQENRSFDHYFGTLRGVRGFADKQFLTWQNGNSIFQQPDPSRTDLGYLLPYNLTDQTDGDLDHSWAGDHQARNGGLWNQWVPAKTEETMGYFTRDEIPFQYAVADAFTICDGYHQAIMAPTSPNRMYFWTGTSSGWTTNPNDYEVDFGPDAGTPEVTTYPELLQAAGIDWQVYTNDTVGDSGTYPDYFLGDYGDNPLWFYQQYNSTNSRNGGTSELAIRGAVTPWQTAAGAPAMSKTHAAYVLSSFIKAVSSDSLPQVSWIVAPAGYCEHPSYTPDYGAHYVNTVLQTLFSNPGLWKSTALFITYDEHDGFFDHQLPPFPEASVADEHIDGLPIGPGTRVPMLICSPWTRGGYVDSNVYDHTSMLRFLATWTGAAKPGNVTSWRESVTGDLTTAFDFRNPDFSIPGNIPTLDQTWALTQLTGGSTTPPAEGDQSMPAQEPGTRPHRPSNHQPFADVTVDRGTGQVTAALTNTGKVGVSLAVYADDILTADPTPVTVLASAPGSYVWDTLLTAGKYAFSVYGPDGFLTSFAGQVVPAGQNSGQVPVVTAALEPASRTVGLMLANEGQQSVVYTLTPNDYEGSTQTVTVKAGGSTAVSWPTDQYGYYDVVITASAAGGFRRRYAGRVA